MKLYQLIDEENISHIEKSLSNGDNYTNISVLTILDKLSSASLSRLRSTKAITEYEQLFDASLLQDKQSAALFHMGIKILISAWKSNTLSNNTLKQKLDFEASRRLALFWKEARNETYPSLTTITDFINQHVQQTVQKWLYNKLSLDENKRLNLYVVRKLKDLLNAPSKTMHLDLLNSTFKVHFLYYAALNFKKSDFDQEFCITIEKKLERRCFESQSCLLSEKIKSLTFTGLLQDWRSNLISITASEELEWHLISILETTEIPKKYSLKLTDLTLCNIVDDFKKNQLDHHLTKYLRNIFKETLQIALFDDLLSDETLQQLSSITSEIIIKWKSSNIDLTMPYPIEKILLPELYQLKKKSKNILSSPQLEKRNGSQVPIHRDDIDQLKLVIARIPKMVETLVNHHLKNTTSRDQEHDSDKEEKQTQLDFK